MSLNRMKIDQNWQNWWLQKYKCR